MKIRDKSIPRDLLAKAKAVVVFPGTIKGAFIVGGQGGKGIAVRRVGNSWSAPAFLNMAGGSVGLQIGGAKTDYILLIMNDKGLKGLLEDKFEIGGSAAVGPNGYAHYLHHKYFEVNYSDGAIPLDKWFGTYHDGSPAADQQMRKRLAARAERAARRAHAA